MNTFVNKMSEICGSGACTYNVHMLTHLADTVRYLGPLWGISMFIFEGYNKTIIKSFNGTNHVLSQMSKKLSLRRSLLKLHEEVHAENPFSVSLNHGLCKSSYTNHVTFKKGPVNALLDEQENLVRQYGAAIGPLVSVKKLECKGKLVTTTSYNRGNKYRSQNCYIYSNQHQCFGQIKAIVIDSVGNTFLLFYKIICGVDAIDSLRSLPIDERNSLRKGIVTLQLMCDYIDNIRVGIRIDSSLCNNFRVCYQTTRFKRVVEMCCKVVFTYF